MAAGSKINRGEIMRRLICLILVLVTLSAVFGFVVSVSAQNKADLETLYMEGIRKANARDYAEAITIFKKIQGIDPTFRSNQIRRYLRVAEGKLGKLGVKDQFNPGNSAVKDIEVTKEGEFEKLSSAAQKVMLDAYSYMNEMEVRHSIPKYEILEVVSSLNMAKSAYDKNQFTEVIRLSNKARLQLDGIIEKRAVDEKPVLGQVGTTPITLNLTDSDLEQTLKLIYDLTGANIILSKGISGRVTINVKDMPLQKVLDLICEANGLRYIEEDKVVKIMTEAEYGSREKAVKEKSRRAFQVFYGDASSIVKALKETFKLETIVYDPRTNSIVVDAGNPSVQKQIQDVISALDTPVSQVLLECKIVEIATSRESLIGIDWLVSSRLIDAIDTTFTGPRFGDDVAFTPGDTSTLPGGFSFGVTNKEVTMLLTALASQGEVKLLQSPKIMTLNGTTAIIRVVQNYPYIIPEFRETYNAQTGARTGTTQTVTVFEEEVGTEFEVTPIIQRNRNVFLTMNIYDSRLIEIKQLSAIAAGLRYETQQPIISSRETTQNVTLFDGQTLIIGGMIQQRDEKVGSGIPFLRKLPILGFLFNKPEYRKTSSELLLFLTPHIVTTFKEAQDLSLPEAEKLKYDIKPGLLEKF